MKHPAQALLLLFIAVSWQDANAAPTPIRLSKAGIANSLERTESFNDELGRKVVTVDFRLATAALSKQKINGRSYSSLSLPGVNLTSDVGLPSLPFQAVTIEAAAADISVKAILGSPVQLKVGRLSPAQEQPCRCPELRKFSPKFVDLVSSYKETGFHRIDSLGDFRGVPVNRVVLLPHRYDPQRGTLTLYPNARFEVSYKLPRVDEEIRAYDYLVISPRALIPELGTWIEHKRSSQGLRFNVVAYEDMNSANADAVKAWIHAEYARAHFKYSLIVGGDNVVPQTRVETTTDRATPSDLPFYTMGDATDVIPEVYGGRVVAENSETLSRVLNKWISYERDSSSSAGWKRVVGIASNEGSSPSDAEYVQSIQNKFVESAGSQSVYFFQDSADSNPNNFNANLNTGAMWVTYLGHGSGTDWPSFGSSYSVPHIAQMRNASAVKPVWIDVACLNGILRPTNAGAHLMGDADPAGAPIGTVAYYGGTVLVSWHPPAIFSRGVAFHVAAAPSAILGEALQAGQKYLSENHSGVNDIASNQRWYHLQGDPSMRLRVK